jgi:hypothetical protein
MNRSLALAAAIALAASTAQAFSVVEFDDFVTNVTGAVASPTAAQQRALDKLAAAAAATYESPSLELKAVAKAAQTAAKAFRTDETVIAFVSGVGQQGGAAFQLLTQGAGSTVEAQTALQQEFGTEKGNAKYQALVGKHVDKAALATDPVKYLKLVAKARKAAEKQVAKYGIE